ncbi:hypothetical protein [Paracoccus luteus]|uniref:hypothetical protein n=1 Tax=Paracoccus luteus TaxID=2508543 RepID=UPI001070282E|nr:hypothetical protein [Paracoccus luteus]
MASTRATFDGAAAQLAELIGRMDDPRGLLANVAEHLLNTTRDRFRDQAGPEGVPGTRLRPPTIGNRGRSKLMPIQILSGTPARGCRLDQ